MLMDSFNFKFTANSQLYFGEAKFKLLPKLVACFGTNLLLVSGAESFQKTNHYQWLSDALKKSGTNMYCSSMQSEPSPEQVDDIVGMHRKKNIQVVIAIGGGSVIDAGKAVSAMLTQKAPVSSFLEQVGSHTYNGKKIPFIAVPTTAGTGSEATKNAVLSQISKNGFKKSLRHENLIPDIAVVDPELTLSCPGKITAACGMDALTQLIESYVSINASPMTDSLALGGLRVMGDSILKSAIKDPTDMDARTRMCYGSYISGLTLANAGLGVVHGFASVIGGYFPIPHGVICGTLLAETTRKNIKTLIRLEPDGTSLLKYATIGKLLGKSKNKNPVENAGTLLNLLTEWTEALKIPLLGQFGVTREDIEKIVSVTGQKNNPVTLSKKDLKEIVNNRI